MFKPSITQLLATLTEALNKKAPQEESPLATISIEERFQAFTETTPNLELGRVADALERIATALEKLTAETSQETNPTEEISWITLPDPAPVPAKPLLIEKIESPKPTQAVPKPPAVIVTPTQPKPKKPAQPAPKPQPKAPVVLAAPTPVKKGVLDKYLEERGITIQEPKKLPDPEKEKKLDQIALYLGKNFIECHELYQLLKKNLPAPRSSFIYSLEGATMERNKLVRDFCQLLKECNLLEENLYKGKPDYKINLKATGNQQKFLEGSWLEKYVSQEVDRIVQPYAEIHKQSYQVLSTLDILFKDNTKTELDLFFALGHKVFCVEAKMRFEKAIITKKLNRIEPLQLENKNILLVVASIEEINYQEQAEELGGVRVTGLNNLEQTIKAMVGVA